MRHFLPPPRVVSLVAAVAAVALTLPAWAGAAPAPTNVRVTNATSAAISIAWDGPSATYGVYRNGRYQANTKVLSYTFSGLECGTSHSLGVRTFFGGGDSSTLEVITAQTASCGTSPPPAATPPANTALPTISGTMQSGATATASPGTWTGTAPIGFAYRWSRCDSAGNACVTIGGATSTSYTLGTADVGSRLRVVVTATNTAGSTSATSPATAVVAGSTTPPGDPPPPPPGGGDSVVLVDRAFVCNGPVNLALVKVTIRNIVADAISLGGNCSGRIGRIEVDTWSSDGIKVQNNSANPAHDLVIEGGYVRCHAIAPGVHQDGMQAMGGARLTFRNLTIDCLGHSNFFVARGGAGASTPTDVVCEGCVLGPNAANAARIATSVRSGLRNTLGCISYRYREGLIFMTSAQSVVNIGNLNIPSGDPRCQNL